MSTQPREQWATRTGFLLAAIGSAVGLGNIWRFPAVTYDNGGGAFLIPYLIALLTAGIPLLILEYTVGRKYRSSAPMAFRQLKRPAETIGWWQVMICVVVASYYAVILAWAFRYIGFSVGQQWGDDPNAFFFGDFLQASEPGSVSTFIPGVAWPLILVWVVALVILAMGVRRGIERANKIFMPMLLVLFLALVIRALTLEGAAFGLDALFTPDWGALSDGSVWVAAYGQIFFSLSIGFGIMITYASYLGRRADINGSGMVVGFTNSSFELLAGIGVFATLGYMALQAGIAVDEVAESGIGLAFIAFPQVISEMPMGAVFGVLFFTSLLIAGLTSLISIVQVVISAVEDHTGLERRTAVAGVGGAIAVLSTVLYATDGGVFFLDAADHFINQYGIALAALVSLIVISWGLRKLPSLQKEADATSTLRLGLWWRFCLGVITPVVLGWMMVDSLRGEFRENYEDMPTSFLLVSGWGVAIAAVLVGVVLTLVPWRRRAAQAKVAAQAGAESEEMAGLTAAPSGGTGGATPRGLRSENGEPQDRRPGDGRGTAGDDNGERSN